MLQAVLITAEVLLATLTVAFSIKGAKQFKDLKAYSKTICDLIDYKEDSIRKILLDTKEVAFQSEKKVTEVLSQYNSIFNGFRLDVANDLLTISEHVEAAKMLAEIAALHSSTTTSNLEKTALHLQETIKHADKASDFAGKASEHSSSALRAAQITPTVHKGANLCSVCGNLTVRYDFNNEGKVICANCDPEKHNKY